MTLIKTRNRLFPTTPSFFDDFFTRDVFDWKNPGKEFANSLPAVNVKENDDGFEVEVAVPGFKKDDFKVEIENDVLTISSEQKSEEKQNDDNYSRREFRYTSFKRSFALPENLVDSDNVQAKYVEGILTVNLPKREEAKPKPVRTIKIG